MRTSSTASASGWSCGGAARAVSSVLLALVALSWHVEKTWAADDSAAFFHAQPLTIVVGYAPGGGYDQAARILARHWGRFTPGNPKVLVRNMPGAGTVVAANHVNNTAAKDGSVIGLYADILILAPLLELPGVQFDPRRLGWIGSLASRGTPVLVLRTDAPATTIEQLRRTQVLIGASGPDATSSYAHLLNDLLGLKLKVLSGYRGGTSEINLAIERGEVHGRASVDWNTLKRQDWIARGLVTVAAQLALRPHPDLPQVPLAIDLAKSEEERQVMEMVFGTNQYFRAFSTPSGVPEHRLAALRTAFAQTMTDPEFVQDLATAFPAGVSYAAPQEIEAFIARVYKFPDAVIKRAAKYVAS